MKRSELRKALEVWFDVERYEVIEKLTLQQFYVEVERRTLAYKMGYLTAGEQALTG